MKFWRVSIGLLSVGVRNFDSAWYIIRLSEELFCVSQNTVLFMSLTVIKKKLKKKKRERE